MMICECRRVDVETQAFAEDESNSIDRLVGLLQTSRLANRHSLLYLPSNLMPVPVRRVEEARR